MCAQSSILVSKLVISNATHNLLAQLEEHFLDVVASLRGHLQKRHCILVG